MELWFSNGRNDVMSQLVNHDSASAANSPGWLSPTIDKFIELLALPTNWDSYGAWPIDPKCALAALRLLGRIMHNDSPPPSVVPTNRGSVQLEWHTGGVDLEINVVSPSEFHVSYEDSSQSWERCVSTDLSSLTAVLDKLTGSNHFGHGR